MALTHEQNADQFGAAVTSPLNTPAKAMVTALAGLPPRCEPSVSPVVPPDPAPGPMLDPEPDPSTVTTDDV